MGHNTQFAGPRAADRLSAPLGETLLPFPPQPENITERARGARPRSKPASHGPGHGDKTRWPLFVLEIQKLAAPRMPWRCFWQKRKPATSLHDCTDIEGVASILTDIGLEALAKTIQIAAKLDRDLSSAVVCDRLNSLAVESFTANKAAFCSPLDRAALAQELAAKAGFLRVQAQSSWRSADDTHKALCPSTDDQNQASRPVCRMPLPLIPPRSKDEVGTRRLAEAGNNSAEQLDRAAAALSVTDSALDNCSPYQTPRKLEPECTTQAVNATPYPKAISSSGATICGLMTSASANSSNASQQRNPGVSLGVEREKTSPSPALTSLHVSFSDSTFSVSHECEPLYRCPACYEPQRF